MHIVGLLAPNDKEEVWNDIINDEYKRSAPDDRDFRIVMEALGAAYSDTNHWSTRRQLLSIVAADFSMSSLAQFIPDLTLWKFNEARRQAKLNGTNVISPFAYGRDLFFLKVADLSFTWTDHQLFVSQAIK